MAVKEIKHPLIKHKLNMLRNISLEPKGFRELTSEISALLMYEASQDLILTDDTIQGWASEIKIEKLQSEQLTIVPILRAGLGMLNGVLSMIPQARVSFVGVYRNEETYQPIRYFSKLVNDIADRTAFILDPMLATGGSLNYTATLLKKAGCKRIKGLFLVAAPEGISNIEAQHPDLDLYCASIDDSLNDINYILPGLGDAGDRIFGTL